MNNKNLSKVVLLTGNELRHMFFCNELLKSLNIVGVITEAEPVSVSSYDEIDDTSDIIKRHFEERDEAEERYFGGHSNFNIPPIDLMEIETRETNSDPVFDWIQKRKPDILVLYGCGIIKERLLDTYHGRIVNLHLGLSPYYRGTGTNFWPLFHREPECVGGTILVPMPVVDGGPILYQFRPNVQTGDRNHDMGCKTIIAGVPAMAKAVDSIVRGKIRSKEQRGSGRCYRYNDFNASAVLRVWKLIDEGLIDEYIRNKVSRDEKFSIFEG